MRLVLSTSLALAASATLNAQATIGTVSTSGDGCVQIANQIFELFAIGAFDLDTTSVSFFPIGGTYTSVPASGIAMLPFGLANGSVDTLQADDSVRGPFSYGFNFPLVTGGIATDADVGSNGHTMLVSGTGGLSRCCSGTAALDEFMNEGESFALLSMDMNPGIASGAGTVWWNVGAPGMPAYATYDGVEEFGTVNLQTCQIQFEDNGSVHLVYSGINVTGDTILTGYSQGGGTPAGVSQDLSAGAIVGPGLGQLGLAMDSASIPTINETTVYDITNVPASALFGGILLGTGAQPVPLDLAGIGFDGGCSLQTLANLPVTLPLVITGSTATSSIPISANGAGFTLSAQALMFAPGENTAGGILSNEVTIVPGDFSFTPPGISVLVNGGNSFNSDTSAGFFSVRHNDAAQAPIASVQFDFLPSGTTREFDTNQANMADRFDGGQASAVGGCINTYRNGSDVATGLIYLGTGASPCDASVEQGWVGSNQIGVDLLDFQTLDFAFTPGMFASGSIFEVDVDTDGAGSTSGGNVAVDLTVTITLLDATVLTGTLTMVNTNTGQIIFP